MDSSTSTQKIEQIFNKGIELHHYANTAYPLDGSKVWKDYRVPHESVDRVMEEEWQFVDEIGLYVHIPFCKSRCLYCEYSVLSGDEANLKEEYTSLLLKEVMAYNKIFKANPKTAIGLDFGGGTPTTLSADSLSRILDSVLSGYKLSDDFSISIETTPYIAATDPEKIKRIRNMGIERISMGMQTIDPTLLEEVGRSDGALHTLIKARDNVREAGFKRFNIDLMYGFANQSLESFVSTVDFAIKLNPEYITLYRVRYKGTKLEAEAGKVSLASANVQYAAAYELLTKNSFDANNGKNTFSRIANDPGTSAYLTKRVIDGTPYLGMGLGAQNMTRNSIYYNQGAASKKISGYRKLIEENRFPIQDMYLLPPEETMAKMICVSFYFGYINTSSFKKKFGVRLEDHFRQEVDFLLGRGLMGFQGDVFQLTSKGKDSLNGIIPLFYSNKSKENLLSKEVRC